jgi:transcriptional regulator with XRE-family HTH domain
MAKIAETHIGRRLREARLLRGLSQTALGKRVGVTFQQIQKYERGVNRIGGSRLWASSSMDCPARSIMPSP